MIRGHIRADGSRRRPFVLARVAIPSQGIADDVHFLVDTGADALRLQKRGTLLHGDERLDQITHFEQALVLDEVGGLAAGPAHPADLQPAPSAQQSGSASTTATTATTA